MPQVIPLVVTAITTVTSAVVAAGPLAVAAFNAVNVIGAAALANEAFKALQPEVRQSGASIEWEANPNAALPFAFGRVGVSGNIVANRVYGPDDMYVGFVSVVSAAGPIKSFVSFKADDTSVSFDASGKAVTSYHANVMWRRTQLGQQPEPSALSSPSGLKNNATMPGWGAAYKLSGKAAYIWTLSENSKRSAYEGRVPTPLNVIEGLYCWDPRLDSTYPGGSGTCRLNDPSTWVWRENPALFALKWALGLWEGPVGKGAPQMGFQVGGIGAKVQNIRVDRLVELANIADANGWKSAAWPKADEPKDQVLDSFLQAAGAVYADEQGKISCIQRAAARPSILTITSDDIAGTVEYDTTTSKIGRLNTIRPRFWSAANDWQMAPTDEVSAAIWREEDGQGQAVTRSKGIDFNYVPGSKQARELACLLVAHTREGIRGTVPVRSYVDVEPGDAFDFEVPEATLNGLKCLVLNAEPDLENDTVLITFASESDGKYAYAYGQAAAPPPAPVLTPSDPTYVGPPLPGDWTIVPRPPGTGGQVPGFDLSGAVGNSTATAIEVEWWEVPGDFDPNDPPPENAFWQSAGVFPPTARTIPINVQPDRYYWIGLTYIRNQNYSARTVSGPWLAGKLIADDVDPTSPTIQDIFGEIGSVEDAMALIDADLTAAEGLLASQGAEIAAARGGQPSLNARIAQVNQARIDGDTAISQTVTGLTARTAATEADIIDLELAQANETTARVQSVNQLTARMAVQPNLLPNSTLVSDTAKWTMGNWFRYVDRFGPGFRVATTAAAQVADSDYISDGISQNTAYTLSGEMLAGAFLGGQVRVALEFWDATTRLVQHVALTLNPGESAGAWKERTFSVVSPAGTTRARLRLVDASTTAGIVVRIRRLKWETGNVATLWTDDAQIAGISAGVTNAANAIVDLQANKASATALTATQAQVADLDAETLILSQSIADAETKLSEARLVFIANGGSGQPARIGLYSDNHGGSAVALDAAKIWFGLNTVFDDATDTIQTVWGSTRKVMAWGAPFGPDNLVEWTGPSSTALSAMTKANAGFWVDQFGAYGPTPAPTFWARVTPTAIAKTRMGAGSISSAVNEVIVSCYTGTSGATCTWSRVSGDTTISFPSTGFTPTFSTTLAVGQTKEALFAGLVTKNGEVAVVYLSVAFQETT